MKTFDGELFPEKTRVQAKVFDAFLTFGINIEEYLHLIVPVIVQSCERRDAPDSLRIKAVRTITGLCRRVNLSEHTSRIIHPLLRALAITSSKEVRFAIMDTFCALLMQQGPDFAVFVPSIAKV